MTHRHDCVLHHHRSRRRPTLAIVGVPVLAMVMTFTLLLLVLEVPVQGVLIVTATVCMATVRACQGLRGGGRRTRARRPGLSV